MKSLHQSMVSKLHSIYLDSVDSIHLSCTIFEIFHFHDSRSLSSEYECTTHLLSAP